MLRQPAAAGPDAAGILQGFEKGVRQEGIESCWLRIGTGVPGLRGDVGNPGCHFDPGITWSAYGHQ